MCGLTGIFAGKGGGASALQKPAAELTAVPVDRGLLRGWAKHLEDWRGLTHRPRSGLGLQAWRADMA